MHKFSIKMIAIHMKKWFEVNCPLAYWGDPLDVRFYLLYLLQGIKGGNILDIGCGPGAFGYGLNTFTNVNISYTGLEINPELCNLAKQNTGDNSQIVNSSWEKLPFKDEMFDHVIMASILEYPLPEERKILLNEVNRVLAPGGIIWVTVPNNKHWAYKNKCTSPAIVDWFDNFREIAIVGWNPIPNFLSNIGPKLSIPGWKKWGTVPPILLSKVPGIYDMIKSWAECGRYISQSKGLVVIVKK